MAVLNAAFPILPGQYDKWQEWAEYFLPGGSLRADWEDQMKRYGITRQCVSLQQTPNGDFVVVFIEGKDPEGLFKGMATSDNKFDKWFAEEIKLLHGLEVSQSPPVPIAELILEYDAQHLELGRPRISGKRSAT